MCWDETRMNDGLDCTISMSTGIKNPAGVHVRLPSICLSIRTPCFLLTCLYPQGHSRPAQVRHGWQPSPSQTRQAQWQLPRRWLDFFLLLTRIRTRPPRLLHRDPTPFPFDPGRLWLFIIRLEPHMNIP